MGYKKEFDIPRKSFDFTKDLAFGEMGEAFIKQFYESVIQGSAEIKTDRYRNGRMVIETQQNPRREVDQSGNQVWKMSGINVTTAEWWVYVYCLPQAFVIVSVDRMKRYLRANKDIFNESTKKNFGSSGDNPARGFLLEPEQVIEMLYSEKYD